ncbi:MAG: DUF3999 domain-containing protein [Chlorobiaceae bacterium]|nr:DUF3999 domain-containing protein [Chlorobiaceae bacterium]
MKKNIVSLLIWMIMVFHGSTGIGATFDERFWEKYTDIELPQGFNKSSLAVINLDPYRFGDLDAKVPFADFRVVSDRREEIPCRVVSKRPVKRITEIPHEMLNLSTTAKGETWAEIQLKEKGAMVNALQLVTPDTDYIRQAEVLGSTDGKTWSVIRTAGVLFDINRGEKMQNTRMSFVQSNFPRLALKIINGGEKPLSITDVRALQENESPGESYMINAIVGKQENDANRKENSVIVRMQTVFPINRLIVETTETNFQRVVTVQKKNESGNWQDVAAGTIYSFDTPAMHLRQTAVEIPEAAAREFRLVFMNHDSPPLTVNRVNGEGFRRVLVFKIYPGRRFHLFWGNPGADMPVYDLAGVIEQQNVDQLPEAQFGNVRKNTKFAGSDARMPFTERYKFLLYFVVLLAVAGLFVLQYRVFRRMKG